MSGQKTGALWDADIENGYFCYTGTKDDCINRGEKVMGSLVKCLFVVLTVKLRGNVSFSRNSLLSASVSQWNCVLVQRCCRNFKGLLTPAVCMGILSFFAACSIPCWCALI